MAKINIEEMKRVEKLVDADNFPMWKFQVSIILNSEDNFEMLSREPTEEEKTKQWLVNYVNSQRIITARVD